MLDINKLNEMIDEKLVSVQKHREADYFIYNYTAKSQYSRTWNEITLQCRGLILDSQYNVISRPFKKFFNLEEHSVEDIPSSSFEVYEKMDGSLGIIYWIGDTPYIATRGSFESDQAKFATNILHGKYSSVFSKLDKSKTYLFEIIYPENRIVVNYGDVQDLILLAIIDNHTGLDCELESIGFPIVKKYDGINDIFELKKLEENNKEGFVIKFQNGFRLKVKFEEYCRLHKIITQVSNKTIWEYLSQGKDFDELLDRVPDEFYNWVRDTKDKLLSQYSQIEEDAKSKFKTFESRRETAVYFLNFKCSPILFKMLDGKDYSSVIWKYIKPEFEKPFANND